MKPLSASQAVWPALLRTRRLLFRPFSWSSYLKLGLAAAVSEGAFVTFRFAVRDEAAPLAERIGMPSLRLAPEAVPLAICAVLFLIVAGVTAFYLMVRLRFAFFNCAARESRALWPAWHRHRAQADRFCVASLLVWVGFALLVLLVVGAIAVTVFTVFTAKTPEGKLDPGVFFILFYPCLALAFTVALAAVAAEVVLHDFILPHMALEVGSFRAAWRTVRAAMWTERETFCSYFILRLLLPFLALTILIAVAWFPMELVSWLLSTSASGFQDMLEDAAGAGEILRMGLGVLFDLLAVGAGLLATAALGGPVGIFLREYALVFYGSRFRPLGEVLEATLPFPDELP